MSLSICVVGAGVQGLSSALRITEEYGAEKVNIYVVAEAFYNQTTSFGSGGLWEPYQIAGTPDEKINSWGEYAFKHFLQLYRQQEGSVAGVQLLTAYSLLEEHEDSTPPSWKDIVFNFNLLSKGDIARMGLPSKYVKGFTFGTLVIEQKYYLRWLMDKLKSLGNVTFIQKKLSSLNEVRSVLSRHVSLDAIVNCCGLGAFSMMGDAEMYPIRGQVLRVKAPWINSVFFFGKSYIIPNVDSVVLGGTAQKGDWNTVVSNEDTEKILNDICAVFPSIRNASIESVWVGLRPGRTPLRLDSELVSLEGEEVLVVHCYGHGGSGITLAMGCADDIVCNHLRRRLATVRSKL